MNMHEVTIVRIYLSEGETQLKNLMKRLRDWEKLRGLSVFRGISGYGESGRSEERRGGTAGRSRWSPSPLIITGPAS